MATPSLTSTPTVIDNAESIASWVGDTFSLEPDDKVQGSNSVSCAQTANGNNDVYVSGSWDFSTDQHLRLWFKITYTGYLSSSNPIQVFLHDGTNTAYYYWAKGTAYSGGWAQVIIYTGATPDSGSVTKSSITRIGMRFVTTAKPRNVPANAWFDAWTYGNGYVVTGGTSGDRLTWADIAAADLAAAYGVVTLFEEVVYLTGDVQLGNGATTTYFRMDTEVAVFKEEQVNSGLYKIHGNGSGCNIVLADSVLRASGTTDVTRFGLDMSDANLASMTMNGTTLVRSGSVAYKSGQDATGNTFNNCGQVTHGGADLSDCQVKNYPGAADTSAVIYNVAADPDGETDNMVVSKGASAHHAIELGVSSPLTMTLREPFLNGFSASNGQNDSALHVKRTSGTVQVNVEGGGAIPTYKSAGATVLIVSAKTATFTPVANGSAFTITKNSDNSVLLDVTSVTGGEVVYDYDGALDGTAATVHLVVAGKEPIDFPWTVAEGTIPISQVTDRNYSNP